MPDLPVSVLVTRPRAQAGSWIDAITEQGWQAVAFPTLEIEPVPLSPENRQRVLDLDRYQGVICVSANAAELGLSLLSDYWPQWPVRQDWYAVGPATAEVMTRYQLPVKVPDQHHSEGLLELSALQSVAEQRFLVLKGVGGREAIQRQLRERGARVDELAIYERVQPETDLDVLSAWLAREAHHYLAFSSGDGLKNFLAMLSEVADARRVYTLPAVVVSERLGKFAREQGFARVIVADGASAGALTAAIRQAERA